MELTVSIPEVHLGFDPAAPGACLLPLSLSSLRVTVMDRPRNRTSSQ